MLVFSFVGLIVYAFLFYGINGIFPFESETTDDLVLSIIIGGLLGWVFKYSGLKLNNIKSWKQNFAVRFSMGFFVHSVLFIGITVVFIYLYINFIHQINIDHYIESIEDSPLKLIIIIGFFVLLIEIIDFSIFSFDHYTRIQIEIQQQLREQLNLQFEALKSQLSPHYLFNSLNTISSLVYRDMRVAENFIRKLAENFQYILGTYDSKLVSLEEELSMVQSYAFLMEIRFENCFELIIDIPEDLKSKKIPPLSLQMLIENALKHNLLTEDDPLIVKIEVDGSKLKVSNLFKPKPSHVAINNQLLKKPLKPDSLSLGLANIRKRYSYFSSEQIQVVRDNYFKVYLPIINEGHEG